MNRRIKTFLVWLLLLAIPLQGFAAVMQLSCGPIHHAAMQSSAASGQEHHAMAGDHAHHHDMTQPDSGASGSHAGSDASDVKVKVAGACSACAACCIGAAVIPSQFNIPSKAGPVVKLVVASQSSFTGFIPASLERPPRMSPPSLSIWFS